jgi:pyruvate dehydrogenase E1 component beta subunit
MLVRAVVGRGWGQAAQHSQSLQAVVAHFPGIEVIMPATPVDAKGLLLSALTGDSPVVCIEHRWNHGVRGPVPEGWYTTPIGRAATVREGTDATIVAVSQMVGESTKAAAALEREGVSCEVLDLRSVRPWDVEAVCASAAKTRRLVVADTGWTHFGVSAEIAARVSSRLFGRLAAPVELVGLPDVPTPCAPALEAAYYPAAEDVIRAVKRTLGTANDAGAEGKPTQHAKPFQGAF